MNHTKKEHMGKAVVAAASYARFPEDGVKKNSGGEYVTNVGDMYVCEICGNKVKVVESGGGSLVCCGQPMKLVET